MHTAESRPRKKWSKARPNIKQQMDLHIAEYRRGKQGKEERQLLMEKVSPYYNKQFLYSRVQ